MQEINVSEISKRYGDVVALSRISFALRAREILGIIGPNGSGKTTLLECMAGFLPVDTGTISCDGVPLPAGPRKQSIFYLPDGILPYPELGVGIIIGFFAAVYRVQRARARLLIERLDLDGQLGRRVRQLSKGYRRRLLLTLGLLSPCPVLMMDEPFDGLDLRQTREVAQLLRDEVTVGRTLVLSIHQLSDAERVCDRFVLLSAGRVAGSGTLPQLRALASRLDSSLEDVFLALS